MGLLPRMAVYLMPLGALAILLAVVQTMMGSPYTLAVEVNGMTVGCVANEDVFDSAREDVLQRVSYAGTTGETELSIQPTYRLAISSGRAERERNGRRHPVGGQRRDLRGHRPLSGRGIDGGMRRRATSCSST